MKNITIIGGSAGFGQWLASFILKEFSSKIKLTITGTREQNTKIEANKLGCEYSINNIEAVKNADIVVFSVPIGLTLEIIKHVCPHIKNGSIVLDVTSIKNAPSKAMLKYSKKDVLVIPTHPMFGPFISTIAGQIFVLTPEEKVKNDRQYKFLKDFLQSNGAKVIEVTPKKHDKMMAVIQGLTHYNMFVLGETIKRLSVDLKESFDFVSPVYKILISFIERYVNQNPKLYSDIQMSNPEILKIHKVFIETANDFHSFIKNQESDKFTGSIEETKKFFGDNSISGQKYTDKIIFLISKQIEKAKKNIGKQITLVNIYSNTQIIGTIKSFENNIIYLDNNESFDINEWEIL